MIGTVVQDVATLPACVAGSVAAFETFGLPVGKYSDIDIFCYSPNALMVGAQRLLSQGYEVSERHERVWWRWLKYGFNSWHTNSLKLINPYGFEVNLVSKILNKSQLSSLSQVLESFDFGLLATGYDLETGTRHDMRSYMFPSWDVDGPLPMMPARRDAWRAGFISQYQGLRELGRYAKYARYGFDMSEVKDDLTTGYYNAATYNGGRTDSSEKQQLSKIYYSAAEQLEADELDKLEAVGKLMIELDSLDAIMDALE